jgi:hypothetical protein
MKTAFCFIPAFILFVFCGSISAGNFKMFPERGPFFGASAMEFTHCLYIGREGGRLANHGNVGAEFPVIGFPLKENKRCLAGVAAAAHLMMFPENMKFAVDNFYAALAVYAECSWPDGITCRFYPAYHVSGHLGDGVLDVSALADARAVSSEMARLEVSFPPLKALSFSAGYGYYYHVCAQKGLTDRFDLGVRWRPVEVKKYSPFITVTGEFIQFSGWRAGADIKTGVEFVNAEGRGLGVCLRYFYRMHPGYYFDRREESAGVQMDFML